MTVCNKAAFNKADFQKAAEELRPFLTGEVGNHDRMCNHGQLRHHFPVVIQVGTRIKEATL